MTKTEQRVYTYILYNSPLKLDYETLSKSLDMTKSHLYKIVFQLFSKGSIKKNRNENGEIILVANSVETIDDKRKNSYIEVLENVILQNGLEYDGKVVTKDKLKEIQKMIYQAFKQ